MKNFHKSPYIYVSEVSIKVGDLTKSLQFYEQIVGLKLLEKAGSIATLTADDRTPILKLEQPEGVTPKEEKTVGLYHFALLLPTRKDLSEYLRHILKIGYPIGAADHHVSEALYLNDPDGNGIEIYRDRPDSEWIWKDGLVHMTTEQLDGNAILAESSGEWSRLPSNTKMGHIHLHVNDVKRAETFYTELLGFEVVSYYPQAAFLSSGNYHHHIAINLWQGADAKKPSHNSVGLNWYTIVYPNVQTLDRIVANLKQQDVPITENNQFIETEDPSGNKIRLTV
ncbi:VOC family protein [Metabacillus malikii]|uniref:Catechol 2,3-dioxygenase n=1 Tax=Metabacillus malikii TaxID=1504265 RepID=A0ABT9ZF65_9BACI|nr:VOC family protein [Metabacillus malikii]MDQ0230879.1 catechol 2,3-dioxygenase [Metabacillus malikii]